tara:strand:- start:209 stop:805 length:597 start_codon:yes stop_codon:yes gene_type:complete
MNRLDIASDQTNFIGVWNIENDNLCKEIIAFFEKNIDLQKKGVTGKGLNLKAKQTTDISINPNDLRKENIKFLNKYMEHLHKCYLDYQVQWPFLADQIKTVDIPRFNIQRYLPGDHFSGIHSERCSLSTIHRLFAWMTYLNDVEDGGTTNFSHYDIKIKPEIGKTLIWPAEWTHAHSGGVIKSGKKYIITGWMNFPTT